MSVYAQTMEKNEAHIPVMLDETVKGLLDCESTNNEQRVFVDCTFGGGSHTQYLLEQDPDCRVIALDLSLIHI